VPEQVAKSLSVRFLKKKLWTFNQTWQAHIMVNAYCVATTRMQKVKG